MPHHNDTYASYTELAQHETEGKDYIVRARRGRSHLAVIAPHGGGIEAGTAALADAVAGSEHSFYAFSGIKSGGNRALHITSHRFDEPTGLTILGRVEVAVAVHGHRDRQREIVRIGGRNRVLKEKIRQVLAEAGFEAKITDHKRLRAIHPQNICNRCLSGRGVQLEISRALREKMLGRLFPSFERSRTRHFLRFVSALRAALR